MSYSGTSRVGSPGGRQWACSRIIPLMNVDCESYNLSPTPTTWKKVEKMNAIWKSDQESLLFQVQSQYWLENGIITN